MVKSRQADIVHKIRLASLCQQFRDETLLALIAGEQDGTHVVTTAGVVRVHQRRKKQTYCATACCRLTVMSSFLTGIC